MRDGPPMADVLRVLSESG